MPADPTQVANQALGWLGAKRITSFLDNSVEAGLIRENFDFISLADEHSIVKWARTKWNP